MKTQINYVVIGIGMIVLLTLTGCADHVEFTKAAEMTPVGFWYGLWHGMILPFAWVVSLFNSDVAIYAMYNNGGWYDFGFALGVGSLSRGLNSLRK